MRAVFMGTPEFAVPALEALISDGHRIEAVVTQPDRKSGRGGKVRESPVKEKALSHGISVYQPERIRGDSRFYNILKDISPDVIVVAAFGQILPADIIHLPGYGCINIHASLLPKYRGAAPVQRAVIDGEKYTGVTTMYMDEGLDTGDILLASKVAVADDDTGESLGDKLAAAGASLILETLKKLGDGTLVRMPQEGDGSYAPMLAKSEGHIDWSMSAEKIERLVRGLAPWPAAYTFLNGRMIKIWKTDALPQNADGNEIGTIVSVGEDGFSVQTGDGQLVIRELQSEGRKRMSAEVFLRGCALREGDRFDRGEIK